MSVPREIPPKIRELAKSIHLMMETDFDLVSVEYLENFIHRAAYPAYHPPAPVIDLDFGGDDRAA